MDELTLLRNLDPDTPGPSPAETAAAFARLLAAIDAQPSASRLAASPSRLSFLERFARSRFWAPVAAAAAVAALAITGAVIGAHSVPATRRPAPGPPSAPLPHLADGLPAYFLEYQPLDSAFGAEPGSPPFPGHPLPSHVTLRVVATATGKVAATATLPGYVTAIAASRGAFFAAVVKDNLARFYEIRLNDSRTATTVTELPVRPDTAPLAFMAVSPDGTKLAYTIQSASLFGDVQKLVVASIAGGSQREWLTPPQDSHGSMFWMTWLADGRTLAFNWNAFFLSTAQGESINSSAWSLRLLDTEAPGSDLVAGKTVLSSAYETRLFFSGNLIMPSPDGRVVVGTTSGTAASRAPAHSVLAFSTATGQVTVLYRVSHNNYPYNGCYDLPLWISNTGSEMLIRCLLSETRGVNPRLVLINHGHATVLPVLDDADSQPLPFDVNSLLFPPPSPSPVHQVVTHVAARGASGSPLSGWEITLIIIVSLILTAGVAIVYLTHRPGP
jgi:hypothetical protein